MSLDGPNPHLTILRRFIAGSRMFSPGNTLRLVPRSAPTSYIDAARPKIKHTPFHRQCCKIHRVARRIRSRQLRVCWMDLDFEILGDNVRLARESNVKTAELIVL